MAEERNVLGTELATCSEEPTTGYLRDGCCHHLDEDAGRHEICAVMTEAFLEYSKARGNDLVTPRPELDFPGLEPGDRWCLCIDRWLEAKAEDVAPPVVLDATAAEVLDRVTMEELRAHEHDG